MRPVYVCDTETLRSANACRVCGNTASLSLQRTLCADGTHTFTPIGWDDHQALGLSIGCWWNSTNNMYQWFDTHTLAAFMEECVDNNVYLVTFNGRTFDGPLCAAVGTANGVSRHLTLAWQVLLEEGYDLLDKIWAVDPDNKLARGNSLGALSELNGLGTKRSSGEQAPILWAAGRHADVLNYCQDDVYKTLGLYRMACHEQAIARAAGAITLPVPAVVIP